MAGPAQVAPHTGILRGNWSRRSTDAWIGNGKGSLHRQPSPPRPPASMPVASSRARRRQICRSCSQPSSSSRRSASKSGKPVLPRTVASPVESGSRNPILAAVLGALPPCRSMWARPAALAGGLIRGPHHIRSSTSAPCCQAARSVSWLPRLTSGRGFRNFYESSRFHVVDIAVYRNVIGNQWVASDPGDILDHTLRVVGEC